MFSCVLVIGFQSEPWSLKSGLGRANTSGTLPTLSLATKVSPLRTLLAGSFGMFVVLGPGIRIVMLLCNEHMYSLCADMLVQLL